MLRTMYQIARFHPRKAAKRRRKVRPLVPKSIPEPKQKPSWQYVMFLSLLFVLICLATYANYTTGNAIWRDLLTSYRNHYSIIVHGRKDYCQPVMNTTLLFSVISEELLNQGFALRNIEGIVKNQTQFAAIAITGTPGVGKTLFVELLEDFFPWPENIQNFSWSEYNTLSQKKVDIMTFLKHLSGCGRNLIVIDDLRTEDVDVVQEYNNYARQFINESNQFSLILIYIFNVPKYTFEQWEQYEERMEVLKGLDGVEVIHFRNFNSKDLDACIRHEAKKLNFDLDRNVIEEVIKTIDVERSGCKNVPSKMMPYVSE